MRMLVVVVVMYVRRCHQNRKSTRIYANREPIHPRLAPLKPHALRACSSFETSSLANRRFSNVPPGKMLASGSVYFSSHLCYILLVRGTGRDWRGASDSET